MALGGCGAGGGSPLIEEVPHVVVVPPAATLLALLTAVALLGNGLRKGRTTPLLLGVLYGVLRSTASSSLIFRTMKCTWFCASPR